MVPTDLIVVGRIGAAFGVKGWLHVKSYAQPAENIVGYKPWYIHGSEVEVRQIKAHGEAFVVLLGGVNDREIAQVWKGREIKVSRSILPPVDAGEFYWHDLIGLKVINPQGLELGRVCDLLETGSNDVLVVRTQGDENGDLLIPFIKDTVGDIDLKTGVLIADWPIDGL